MPDLSPAELLLAFLFLGLLAQAVISDMQSLRIPNGISLALVALYPAFVVSQGSYAQVPAALLSAVVIFGVGAGLFALGVMGGGDVKLLTATGLWAGREGLLDLVAISAISGAALAVVMMSRLRFPLAAACDALGEPEARDTFLGRSVPYAIAIAAGGYCTVGHVLLHLGTR